MCIDNLCGENQILAANAFSLAISKCENATETANLARFFSIVSTMLASIAACKLQEELSERLQSSQNLNQDDIGNFVPPFTADIER